MNRKKTTVWAKAFCLLLCYMVLQLAACAPKQKIPEIKAEYYPQCVQPFKELAEAQRALVTRTVASAALGAAGGAIIGALATGDWKGALAGGITGGVVAGTVGYSTGKQQQIADVQERLRSYRTDMRTDIRNMSRVELYSMLSLQCYIREFRGLLVQYKANQISREEFQKRYKEINTGMTQISGLLDDAYTQAVQRDQEYRQALASERTIAKGKAKNNRTLEAAARKNSRQAKAIARADSLNEISELVSQQQKISQENVVRQDSKLAQVLENNTNTSLDALSNDFDSDYTTTTVKIAATKDMYAKALDIMNDSAEKAGIDMVNLEQRIEVAEGTNIPPSMQCL